VTSTTDEYRHIRTSLQRQLPQTARSPPVAREVDHYLARIGKVKSIEDLIADGRLFAFAMKAHGLDDMTYAKGFMRKVLSEGIDNRNSFANRLADGRYREFAEVFNFARYGTATTAFERTQQDTVDRYLRQTLEIGVRQRSEGAGLALHFERRIGYIKDAYGILADPALLAVARTVLDIPAAASALDIDRQARQIGSGLDIASLSDGTKLRAFLERFAVKWDLAHPSQSQTASGALQIRPTLGMATSVLGAIQALAGRTIGRR